MIISISGFTVEESEEIQSICSKLSFEFSSALISGTKVLISSCPSNSSKLKAALKYSIPVVSRNWLDYLLKQNSSTEIDALKLLDRFKMNDLFGKLVSSTGFSEADLPKAVARIKQMGGNLGFRLSKSCLSGAKTAISVF